MNFKKDFQETKKYFFYKISIVVLVIALVSVSFLLLSRSKQEIKDLQKFSLIDPARNFISQSNYIINLQPLRDRLVEISEEFKEDSFSVYIEFLNTGGNITLNQDNYIWPASLAKLPLALAVVKKIERNDWKFSNELVLLQEDRNAKSGDRKDPLAEFPVGSRFTIEKLLEEMLINSDNTAFNMLLRNLHNDDVQLVIDELGLEELFTKDGKVSSKEYSRIFRALYTSSFLKRENSQKILHLLDQSVFNNFLAQVIPEDIPFPHKYGENFSIGVYADSGIVYLPGRPYLITVIIQPNPKKSLSDQHTDARKFMYLISEETYNYFLNFQ